METAVVAALVAGVVSLVGVIVNLRIARETREASREQIRLAAAIRAGEEAVKALAVQMTKVERFRVECWEMHELVSPDGTSDFDHNRLATAMQQFRMRFDDFLESWVEAKGEVPHPQAIILRGIRHDCKNLARQIFYELQALAQESEEGSNGEEHRKQRKSVQSNLSRLLSYLDRMFHAVNSVRLRRFAEMLSSSEPAEIESTYNPGPQPDGTAGAAPHG